MTLGRADCDLNHNCTCLMLEHTFGAEDIFVKKLKLSKMKRIAIPYI